MKSSKSWIDRDFYAVEFLSFGLLLWEGYSLQNNASVLPNYFIFFYYACHKFGMELVASLIYMNDGFI